MIYDGIDGHQNWHKNSNKDGDKDGDKDGYIDEHSVLMIKIENKQVWNQWFQHRMEYLQVSLLSL